MFSALKASTRTWSRVEPEMREGLVEAEIQCRRARSAQRVAGRVAERADRIGLIDRRVEPPLNLLGSGPVGGKRRIAGLIRALAARAGPRVVHAARDGQPAPGLRCEDAGQRPARDDGVDDRLTEPSRNLPEPRRHPPVPSIRVGEAPVEVEIERVGLRGAGLLVLGRSDRASSTACSCSGSSAPCSSACRA